MYILTPQSVLDEKPESMVTGPCVSQICGEVLPKVHARAPRARVKVKAQKGLCKSPSMAWRLSFRTPRYFLYLSLIDNSCLQPELFVSRRLHFGGVEISCSLASICTLVFGLGTTSIDSESSKRLNVPVLLACVWH